MPWTIERRSVPSPTALVVKNKSNTRGGPRAQCRGRCRYAQARGGRIPRAPRQARRHLGGAVPPRRRDSCGVRGVGAGSWRLAGSRCRPRTAGVCGSRCVRIDRGRKRGAGLQRVGHGPVQAVDFHRRGGGRRQDALDQLTTALGRGQHLTDPAAACGPDRRCAARARCIR
jgi:hypothetical protein